MKKKKHYFRKITALILTVLVFISATSFSASATSTVKDTEVVIINDSGERTVVTDSSDVIKKAETTEEIGVTDGSLEDADLDEISESTKKAEEDYNKRKASSSVDSDISIVDDNGKTYNPAFRDDWSLILVNKEHLIPDDYTFELSTIQGAIQADVRVAPHLVDMVKAARDEGIGLYVASSYRDLDRQTYVFERKIDSLMEEGYTRQEAYKLASEVVAIPGSSEHTIGLAFDLVTNEYNELEQGFAYTTGGRWLKEHAHEYGFILRYPKGKEEITKIEFEPWHYRYVGVKAAKEITESGLCLEEYVQMIGLVEE